MDWWKTTDYIKDEQPLISGFNDPFAELDRENSNKMMGDWGYIHDNFNESTNFNDSNTDLKLRQGFDKLIINDKLVYAGEWKDDLKHGLGSEYVEIPKIHNDCDTESMNQKIRELQLGESETENTMLLYSGEWQNNMRHGFGQSYLGEDELEYEGEWQNNMRHGRGKLYQDNHLLYYGEFQNDKFHGVGTLYSTIKPYMGHLVYQGEFVNGEFDGFGELYLPDGVLKYSGEFSQGQFDGEGTEYLHNNRYYVGTWTDNKRQGDGVEYYSDGTIYHEVVYNNDVKNGTYKSYWANGNVCFVGTYVNGKVEGYSRAFYRDGNKHFEGTYLNNLPSNGTFYDESGKVIYKGMTNEEGGFTFVDRVKYQLSTIGFDWDTSFMGKLFRNNNEVRSNNYEAVPLMEINSDDEFDDEFDNQFENDSDSYSDDSEWLNSDYEN